jgi:hypothetical protein
MRSARTWAISQHWRAPCEARRRTWAETLSVRAPPPEGCQGELKKKTSASDNVAPVSETSNRIVQKLWSYCNVLRDDGLSYQDYLEQLTFLLFLKMADERARLTGEGQPIPYVPTSVRQPTPLSLV